MRSVGNVGMAAVFAMLTILTNVACDEGTFTEIEQEPRPTVLGKDLVGENRLTHGAENLSSCNYFNAYAVPGITSPPTYWSPYFTLASHIGPVNYQAGAWPVGNTDLWGTLRFWGGLYPPYVQIEDVYIFNTSTQAYAPTCDCVANVEAKWSGWPSGSAVNGWICPGP